MCQRRSMVATFVDAHANTTAAHEIESITPQKSNIDTKIAIFQGSYLFQNIILGPSMLVFGSVKGCLNIFCTQDLPKFKINVV